MSKRKCARCGKDPAEGYANYWTAETGTVWYCHGDDDESPTCYEQPVLGSQSELLITLGIDRNSRDAEATGDDRG